MCSELKDPDKLVHVGWALLLCGTLKWNTGLALKFYPEWFFGEIIFLTEIIFSVVAALLRVRKVLAVWLVFLMSGLSKLDSCMEISAS